LGGLEFDYGGDDQALAGPDLAADAAMIAVDGAEFGGVSDAVAAGIGGGEHRFVEPGLEEDDVRVVDAQLDAVGDEGGDDGIGAVVFGGAGCVIESARLPVFGEADFGGVEAVFGAVARRAGLAFGRARAGGFARVIAVGGEALFGDHRFLLGLLPAVEGREAAHDGEEEARAAGAFRERGAAGGILVELLPGQDGAERAIDVGVGFGEFVVGLFDLPAEALVGDVRESFLHPDLFGDIVGEDLAEEVGGGVLLVDAGAEPFELGAVLDGGEGAGPGRALGVRGLGLGRGGDGAPEDGGFIGFVEQVHSSDLCGRVSREGRWSLL
jgi:hypothetical protein